MIRLRPVIVVALAALALYAIRQTTPEYAMLRGPVVRKVGQGETGHGPGFDVTLTGLHIAEKISTQRSGTPVTRTTDGVWLVAHIRLTATGDQQVHVLPAWIGPSGRRYQHSSRIGANDRLAPGAIVMVGQPARDVLAIFELPAVEVAGGTLALGTNVLPSFDSELRMAAPDPVMAIMFDSETGTVR